MKFVFLGYDFMLPVAQRLITDGHELIGILSFPCDQTFNFNHNCRSLAQQTGATYIESPINQTHIDSLIAKGAELFVSAGYPHKIPPILESKAYGINVHPSFLPKARGAMPVPHIIINENHDAAGYTIHKLAPEFDTGDILYQEKIALDDDECVERYCAKTLTMAPNALSHILNNFDRIWINAKPQYHNESSVCKLPDDDMRTLNWSQDVQHILRTQRAFGRYGCFANFGNRRWNVYACDGWTEQHDMTEGECISVQNNIAVIAAKNGFIALKEFKEVK